MAGDIVRHPAPYEECWLPTTGIPCKTTVVNTPLNSVWCRAEFIESGFAFTIPVRLVEFSGYGFYVTMSVQFVAFTLSLYVFASEFRAIDLYSKFLNAGRL